MGPKHLIHLSLGSNLDNKLLYLEKAIQAIHKSIANVTKVSSVYRTPAWGFEGNDFFNICIEAHTEQPPEQLLTSLLAIEKKLGRKEKNGTAYENRCIDIDIILYEDKVISTAELSIPHPRAVHRKFVLLPLKEIHKNAVFPDSKNTITHCIKSCTDNSFIEKTAFKIAIN